MAFGFFSINNGNKVQIDNNNRVLLIEANGTYVHPPLTGSTNNFYATPVVSIDPPLIFLKPNDYGVLTNVRHIGSAGNWTGFTLFDDSFAYGSGRPFPLGTPPSGKYIAAVFGPSSATGGFGMNIFGPSGERIYSSSRRLLLITGVPQSGGWSTYPGYVAGPTAWYGYQNTWTGSADDYYLASSLIGGVHNSGATIATVSAGFASGNRNIIISYINLNNSVEVGSPINGRTFFAARPYVPI